MEFFGPSHARLINQIYRDRPTTAVGKKEIESQRGDIGERRRDRKEKRKKKRKKKEREILFISVVNRISGMDFCRCVRACVRVSNERAKR